MSSALHVADIGTTITVTLTDETGAAVGLSLTTTKQFVIVNPNGVKQTVAASFVTDGGDGKLKYTIDSNDLDVAGTWSIQAIVVFSDATYHSSIETFTVEANL